MRTAGVEEKGYTQGVRGGEKAKENKIFTSQEHADA